MTAPYPAAASRWVRLEGQARAAAPQALACARRAQRRTSHQMVMMPSEGAAARAHQLGALARVAHERATGEDIGEWLAALEDAQLDEVGRDIARLARRDWERSRRVP